MNREKEGIEQKEKMVINNNNKIIIIKSVFLERISM